MPGQCLIAQTATLVAAYVARNHLSLSELPAVIGSVHAALQALSATRDRQAESATKLTGAEIAASAKHDCIVSFIDGKPYKSLKRHLAAHGLTPERYRTRYGLPEDYPLVAPSYAALRSQIAKSKWLGHTAA